MGFQPSYEMLKRINEAKYETGVPVEIIYDTGMVCLYKNTFCNKQLIMLLGENADCLYLFASYTEAKLKPSLRFRNDIKQKLIDTVRTALNQMGVNGFMTFNGDAPAFFVRMYDKNKKMILYAGALFTLLEAMDENFSDWFDIVKGSNCWSNTDYNRMSMQNSSSYYSNSGNNFSCGQRERDYTSWNDSYEAYRIDAGWCGDEDDCPEEW